MKTMVFALGCLALATAGWAHEEESKGHLVVLPRMQQVTVQGLYGENRLVRAAGSPVLGLTYTHFDPTEIHVGEWEESDKKRERLHLPSFGWFVDGLAGSRAGTQVRSVGFGGAVRLTVSSLKGEQTAPNQWYYGLGSGLYATRVEAARRSTGVGLGFRLFGGKDFTNGGLIEVSYSYRPGTQGTHPSGLSLGLGRRF